MSSAISIECKCRGGGRRGEGVVRPPGVESRHPWQTREEKFWLPGQIGRAFHGLAPWAILICSFTGSLGEETEAW